MVLSIPCSLDERPKAFHHIGMDVANLPFLTTIKCLVFHFLTDFVVASILIGNVFRTFGIDESVDEVGDRLTSDVGYELCDDVSTPCNCAQHGNRGSSSVRHAQSRVRFAFGRLDFHNADILAILSIGVAPGIRCNPVALKTPSSP